MKHKQSLSGSSKTGGCQCLVQGMARLVTLPLLWFAMVFSLYWTSVQCPPRLSSLGSFPSLHTSGLYWPHSVLQSVVWAGSLTPLKLPCPFLLDSYGGASQVH